MSRIGKQKISLPNGVTAGIEKNQIFVKGPKGELRQAVHPRVIVAVDGNEVSVSVVDENNKQDRSLWGTFSSLVQNLVEGVPSGFKKQLEINGVGYKVAMKGANLALEVGFSHPVEIKPLPGLKFSVEKNMITIEGSDKQMVGEMSAQIRKIKKPEPYKGKGLRYHDEVIRRKQGKKSV